MKKQLAIVTALSFLSMGFSTLLAKGLEREKRELGAFKEIEVGSTFTVEINKGNTYTVELESDSEDLEKVITTVKNGELIIKMSGNDWWSQSKKRSNIKLYITTPELVGLEASGNTQVKVLDVFQVADFDLDLSGASQVSIELECSGTLEIESSGATTLNLKGKAGSGDVEASGASNIKADDFNFINLDLDLSGASMASVGVSDTLNVEASGAATVKYSGNPKSIDINSSGASKVSKRS